ncbi:tail fiber assembly protein [Yersinia enterocolitica]|nr:tail fiber assembly protein [Yersinia enterocolitica]
MHELAVLDDNGLAISPGVVNVFNIDPTSREYISTSEEYLAVGVGIPSSSYTDAPPASKSGFAVCRSVDGNAWEHMLDNRGQTVYDIQTGRPDTVTVVGELAEGFTLLAPTTPFDKWNGKNWVTDTAAVSEAAVSNARNELLQRQRVASDKIATLEDAVSLDLATEQEVADLKAWKVYRVLLNRVDVTKAPNIDWPAIPA